MSPVLPLLGLGLLFALARRSRAPRYAYDPSGAPVTQRYYDPSGAPVKQVSGELDDVPTIEAWLSSVSGAPEVYVGITWPNDHYSEFSARGPAVGFDLSEAFAAAELLVAGEDIEIGRTSPDKLSEEQHAHRMRLTWRSFVNAKPKDRPKGWKLDAPQSVVQGWWSASGAAERKANKIRYAALMDNAPAGLSDDQMNRWWFNLSKGKREKLKDPYDSTFLEDVGDFVESAVEPLATYVLPQALNLVVPGSGAAVTAAIVAAKLAGKAVKGKASPKDLLGAAMSAAGQPDATKVLEAVQTVKKKTAAIAQEKKATATKVAKAKAVATVADTLKSPATVKALQKVGVPAAQTAKAAAVFNGIKSAAASLASRKKGDTKAAEAYAKAAEAHARVANVPAATVNAGGQKLYYLALTPGA
jgi:hypothetical protein